MVRLHDVQASRRAAAFLVRRLELLDADALSLLSVGAVLGKQFDLDVAVQVAQLPAAPGQVVDEARRRRLLWVDEARADAISSTTRSARRCSNGSARTSGADCTAARPTTSSTWSGSGRGDAVFDLAYHLDAAGRHVEAVPYALAGADVAAARYGLDAAVGALPDGGARSG